MVKTCLDAEDLAQTAAQIFVEQSQISIRRSGRFNVVLSGGSTPKRTYQLLSESIFQEKVDWSRVFVFWGDERCVPHDSPHSNYGMANKTFLSKVSIPSSQIFPIPFHETPEGSAIDYEKILRHYFRSSSSASFDLLFLGLGDDGHTASLFPDSPALDETKNWVKAVKNEKENFSRITLTPSLLNQANFILFLVTGESKREILRKVMMKPDEENLLPAQLIHSESGETLWLISPK